MVDFTKTQRDEFFKRVRWKLANAESKLVDNLDLGNFVKKTGDYKVYDKGRFFIKG